MPVNYMPVMNVRPSEITAVTEVPDIAKDRMLPFFQIRPWLGRGLLNRATDRILQAVGSRVWIAALDLHYEGADLEGVDDMDRLKSEVGDFENWKQFVNGLPNAIPAAQVCPDVDLFGRQLSNLASLGRGVAVRFDRNLPVNLVPYIEKIVQAGIPTPYIILDYGQRDARLLHQILLAVNDCRTVLNAVPDVKLALSATTFPGAFEGIDSETIYERSFHANVMQGIPSNTLIYSDHGSTRIQEDRGGGTPRPRIDIPRDNTWYFFRSDLVREKGMSTEEYVVLRDEAYKEMANRAINSQIWDSNLNIWGTQFIKITQLGSEYGINSPAKATACRINIHLTRQALYGAELTPTDFEEEWVD